jgi:glutathione reductase (NADPH)
MTQERYDLVVIGAGSGGLVAARFAAKLGAKVALAEKNRIGVDCTWTGCVPSKALLKAAKIAHEGEEHVTISDEFLELESLPRRILFVGGGYISMEFAHVSLRADREVTILHRGKRLLEGFDADLVQQLLVKTRQLGALLEFEAEVKAIEKRNPGLTVHAEIAGSERTFAADMVVHGAGRVPDIEDLNLAEAKVESEKRSVKVNEFMQSVSNPAIYAAGDARCERRAAIDPCCWIRGRHCP